MPRLTSVTHSEGFAKELNKDTRLFAYELGVVHSIPLPGGQAVHVYMTKNYLSTMEK